MGARLSLLQATENGVLVVTNMTADNLWVPTFRNARMINNSGQGDLSEEEDAFLPDPGHICAILAPFWTDAQAGNHSKVRVCKKNPSKSRIEIVFNCKSKKLI